MKVEWTLVAQTFLDQLSQPDRARVEHALQRLGQDWSQLRGRLSLLKSERAAEPPLFSLRVGHDLRVLLRQRDDTISVVDVVRRTQIEGLRDLWRARGAGGG